MFKWILIGLSATILFSCGVNSNIMLKTPYDEIASLDSLPIQPEEEYRIGIYDKVSIQLSANGGVNFFDAEKLAGGSSGGGATGGGSEFEVQRDSTIDVPIIGRFKVGGLTKVEAKAELEEAFSMHFIEPFVKLNITNQRVIIFPGDGGSAQVLTLNNTNMTLMEVLATAGGIANRGRANRIKLIRKEGNSRKMYVIDLSTVDGLKYTDLIVQANDYIYVEPKAQLASEALRELTPILSIISTVTVLVTLFTLFR